MGYDTKHTLTVVNEPHASSSMDVVAKLRKACEEASYSLDDCGRQSGNDSRWYDHESDLEAWTRDNPGILLQLEGAGDDRRDWWRKWFMDGKMLKSVKAAFEAFDPLTLLVSGGKG